ncbi:MAG: hypothetical protein OEZ34_07665 [Spirochaetia bacterium]|nr:hypothetical protein [Spirochaetia bacterium]
MYCSKPVPSTDPIDPDLLKWGSSISHMDSVFLKHGWIEIASSEGRKDYTLKIGDDDETFDPIMDEVVYPYKASLFFNQNRLSIARIFRSGSKEEIKKFKEDFLSKNSLGSPEWESIDQTVKTQSGNSHNVSSRIYSSEEILVKIHENSIVSKETKVKDESIEIQIFSIKENEGISVKGLAELH